MPLVDILSILLLTLAIGLKLWGPADKTIGLLGGFTKCITNLIFFAGLIGTPLALLGRNT